MSELERPYYAVLGVSSDATAAQIKAAYRRLVQVAHPDRGGDAEAFVLLNQAYETLRDPDRREEYDLVGAVHEWNPAAFQESVLQSLAAAFEMTMKIVIESGHPIEMVHFMNTFREMIGNGLANFEHVHGAKKAELDALHKLRKRIKRVGEGRNMFVEIIDAQIAKAADEMKRLSKDLDIARRCVEEAAHYDDVDDFIRTMQASRYTGWRSFDIFGESNVTAT